MDYTLISLPTPTVWHSSGDKKITGGASNCDVSMTGNKVYGKPEGAYGNAYVWNEGQPCPEGHVVLVDFTISVYDYSDIQAVESDSFQLERNGWRYNGGIQANLHSKQWKFFDYPHQKWEAFADLDPLEPAAGHDWWWRMGFVVDDTAHTVTLFAVQTAMHLMKTKLVHQAVASTRHDRMNRGWQIDGASQGRAFNAEVKRHEITVL